MRTVAQDTRAHNCTSGSHGRRLRGDSLGRDTSEACTERWCSGLLLLALRHVARRIRSLGRNPAEASHQEHIPGGRRCSCCRSGIAGTRRRLVQGDSPRLRISEGDTPALAVLGIRSEGNPLTRPPLYEHIPVCSLCTCGCTDTSDSRAVQLSGGSHCRHTAAASIPDEDRRRLYKCSADSVPDLSHFPPCSLRHTVGTEGRIGTPGILDLPPRERSPGSRTVVAYTGFCSHLRPSLTVHHFARRKCTVGIVLQVDLSAGDSVAHRPVEDSGSHIRKLSSRRDPTESCNLPHCSRSLDRSSHRQAER